MEIMMMMRLAVTLATPHLHIQLQEQVAVILIHQEIQGNQLKRNVFTP